MYREHFDPKRRPNDSAIMQRAISDGVIKTQWPNKGLYDRLDHFASFHDLAPPTPSELNQPAQAPQTAEYVENTAGPITRPIAGWIAGSWYELSRIWIPGRQLGIIRQIETLVTDRDGAPINNNPFGNYVLGVPALRFMLRLSCARPAGLGNYQTGGGGVYNVPGIPFYQLATWPDIRFPWGGPANEVFFTLPEGHWLRLFVYFDSSWEGRNIAGRMQGTRQTANSISAAWNARRGWT